VPFVPESVELREGGPGAPDDWSMSVPLTWTGTFRGQIGRLLVPASEGEPFVTDLASVPRSLTWLVPRYGMYTKAAVLHDYLCQTVGKETIAEFVEDDAVSAMLMDLGIQFAQGFAFHRPEPWPWGPPLGVDFALA
jgi:hypothetical protein